MKSDRRQTNNGVQHTTQKTEDRAPRTPLIIWGELKCCGKVSSSCHVSLKLQGHYRKEKPCRILIQSGQYEVHRIRRQAQSLQKGQ